MIVKSYQDLEIYQRSLELARKVYLLTKNFPKDETYGMRDQIRRAVASIGANIAEGFGRYHFKDKLVFFYNARGSLYETKHFIELSCSVGYIKETDKTMLFEELDVLSVKLNNFISSIGKQNEVSNS